MRKLLFILLIGICSSSVYSQIGVWKPKTENPAQKPPVYDSLFINFRLTSRDDVYKHLQFIGQRLFFKPLSQEARKNFTFNEFILPKDTVIRGEVLVPFEQSITGRLLYEEKKGKSIFELKSYNKYIKEKEENYLNYFNFHTDIYKPIFTKYKKRNGSDDLDVQISSDLKALENKSFLILNIYSGTSLKDTVALAKAQNMSNGRLLFKLADENGDILFWKTDYVRAARQNLFVIQGYYDKQISFYKNSTLVYRKSLPSEYVALGDRKEKNNYEVIITSNLTNINSTFEDLNTGQTVPMKDLDEWTCKDVVLIEEGAYNSLFYILASKAGNMIKVPVGEMAKSGFVFSDSYAMEEKVRKLKAEELAELRKQEEIRQQEQAKSRLNYLTAKFGAQNAKSIAEGNVTLGMTKEMCGEAWGYTNSVIKNYNREIWVYGYGSSLSFVGNKLVQIINL